MVVNCGVELLEGLRSGDAALLLACRPGGHRDEQRIEPVYDQHTGRLRLLKYDADGNGAMDTFSYMDGSLVGKRFLLHDRDPLFSTAFRETLAAAGVEAVRLPPCSPNLNAVAERFVRTIKESCLDRLILIGAASLRRALREFVVHYHHGTIKASRIS